MVPISDRGREFPARAPWGRTKTKGRQKPTLCVLELARPAGFEPTTPWFVARYSIQLSYGRELEIISARAFSPAPASPLIAGIAVSAPCRARRLSTIAFAVHAMPSHVQMNASGHATTRGQNAATVATAMTIALTRNRSPASAGPNARRLVIAAPSALPTLTAPAAARLALPDSDRRLGARNSLSRGVVPSASNAGRTRLRRVNTISVVFARSRSNCAAIFSANE